MTDRRLESRTWPEIGAEGPVHLVVPLGSCEQHGPHLPLGTDTLIATAVAHRLADRRASVLVAPALPIGASWEHAGFPGLLSFDRRLVGELLVELAHSADWAAGLVFVNGHGGNAPGVADAVAVLRAEGRRVLAWSPRLPGGDAHAGRTETSIMLALAPGTVRLPLPPAGHTGPLDEVVRRGVAPVSPSGVLGDPGGATAAHGEELLSSMTDDLVSSFDAWCS